MSVRDRARDALRHAVHPLYKRLETSVHPLRYLFVEITQRCNLACLHCGSDCSKDAQLDELSTDEWLAFFARLARRVDTRRLVLVVTGGEPFCTPHFDRILGALRDHGFAWGMVTNGTALTPANVDKVVAHGLHSITVSLDGLEDAHDHLRGRAGTFRKAVAGLRLLAQAPIPFFDVVTCVYPRNLEQLDDVHTLLGELGVPAWRLFSIFPKGRARENAELFLSPEQFRRMMAFIERKRSRGALPQVDFSCEGYMPAELDRQVREAPYFCRAGINIASVLCDGSIGACPNIARSLVQGNVRHDDLLDVWEQRFQKHRDRAWMRTGKCVGCDQWARCQGNSLHLWDDDAGRTALCTWDIVQAR